jgi:arginine deiminase
MFINQEIPKWYDRYFDHSIEGGDQLVLSKKVIAIGISQRTNPTAIERFAKEIFNSNQGFETILAFDIPKKRAFMHLDTVFTMVDYDKFTIHPEIEGPLTVYSIRNSENGLVIEKENNELDKILSKYLNIPEITLIRCGGKKGIDAGREQWNDGSNTLAVSPGEVIVYSRNHVTNKILRDYGIKLHVIPSSELSRGRGGPRCMSMPLYRENL